MSKKKKSEKNLGKLITYCKKYIPVIVIALISAIIGTVLSLIGPDKLSEMTDIITFQHAYQANAKMISTIDELLDVVINGLKR